MRVVNKMRSRRTTFAQVRPGTVFGVVLLALIMVLSMAGMSFATGEEPTVPAAGGEQTETTEPAGSGESGAPGDQASDPEVKEDGVQPEESRDEGPALSPQTITAKSGGCTITVRGELPEDAQLQVAEIGRDDQAYDSYARDAAAKVFEKDGTVEAETLPYARFFDITILSGDGQSVFQPADDMEMTIDTGDKALRTKDVDFAAFHFTEEGGAELLGSDIEKNKMKLVTDSFSVYGVVYYYTVDFYYTPEGKGDGGEDAGAETAEYHMNGGSEMMMSELFDKLGIERSTGNITQVDFTDESLVTFTEEEGDWRIRSLKPFTTGEVLTITFSDGSTVVIGVEDAVSGNFGTNLTWEIGDDGVLIIKPVGESGTLPNSSGLGDGATDEAIAAVFPWHTYKDDDDTPKITKVVIQGKVLNNSNNQLRSMFTRMKDLAEADLTGLDATNVGAFNDVFKDCTALKEVILPDSFSPRDMYRAFRNCSSLTTIQFGTEEKPYDPQIASSRSGYSGAFLTSNMTACFIGCTSLTTLKAPGADLSAYDNSWTNRFDNFVTQFNSANDKDKIIEMPNAQISPYLTARIFQKSTIAEVYLQGATIRRNYLYNMFHDNGNAPALKKVDMTGTRFIPEKDGDRPNAYGLFSDLAALEEVILTNADFGPAQNFNQMFQDSTALKKVLMNSKDDSGTPEEERLNIDEAVKMFQMFKGCTGLEELDLSGFGKMDHIVSVQDMFKGCTSLKTLDISNMDNSRIKPACAQHPASNEDEGAAAQNVNWNRLLALETCTGLKTIIAKNSKVWLVGKNSDGMPGEESYSAAYEEDIYYLTRRVITYTSDDDTGNKVETIDSKRDWIDLIKDHSGQSTGSASIPDANENINYKDGHLNTNGAGFLAPGVYEIGTAAWEEPSIELEKTYYRISNIDSSDPSVVVSDSQNRITNNGNVINTKVYTTAQWDSIAEVSGNDRILKNADGSPLITLTYPDAAEDINGVKHDVTVKINAVTFKDIDRIPSNPNVTHDPNNYQRGQYSRAILEYSQGFLNFKNYLFDENGNRALSGGAGTDIDFTIEVADSLPGTSVLFYMEDLDIPASQEWNEGIDPQTGNRDWCYDNLPFDQNTYGPGSEGMILGSGNDLDTLKFADHTGLEVIGGTQIVPTGSDPTTAWSAFCVRASASGADYTWTSGIACNTYLLKQTEPPESPEPVYVMLEALKSVNDTTPSGTFANGFFTFDFKKANVAGHDYYDYLGRAVDVSSLTNEAENKPSKNNVRDVVVFDTLPYLPNRSAERQLFIYEISEQQRSSSTDIIKYDDTKYYMQIVVTDPVTDLELFKGTRAEIILGTMKHGETAVSWDTDRTITVWANDAQLVGGETGPHGEPVFRDANGTLFYRDVNTGELKPYGSSRELTPAVRAQVDKRIYFNKEQTEKTVKVDHNGVEYIEGSDGKYYDPRNQQPMLVAKTGDIDPARTDRDNVVAEKKTVSVEGSDYDVRKDIHGVEYYVKGGKYYRPADHAEIQVQDGVFNPDPADDGDKFVYRNKTHEYNGQTYDVYRHANGREYFVVGTGDDRQYRNPADDSLLTVKTDGDVDPDDSDANATTNKTEYKERKETVTGSGNTIKKDKNGVDYFKNAGGDGKYYTPYNTLLEVKAGVFEPDDDSDKPEYHTYEIWVDSEGNEFYKNEQKYFDMSGREVQLSDDTLDTSEIVYTGNFRNEIKTSEITVKKEAETGSSRTAGTFVFRATFDNSYNPLTAGYSYDPAGTAAPIQVKKSPNTWEFILEEGQEAVFKNVPFQTTYSIEELPERGYELSKIETGESGTQGEIRDVTITKQVTDDNYRGEYDHTFTNRMTQLIVDKNVTNVPEGVDISGKEFSFTAEVTKDGLQPGQVISFGCLQEDESQEFETAKAGDDGKATGSIRFTLKDKEDIALVVPRGADVKVKENTESFITFVRLNDGDEEEGSELEAKNVQNQDDGFTTMHFINKYVLPVDYDKIKVEKVISNHHFMTGYKFEMALIPSEQEHTPMPADTETVAGDGVYAPAVVTADPDRETDDHLGYWRLFDPITFTNEDMVEKKTVYVYGGHEYPTRSEAEEAARSAGGSPDDVTEKEKWEQVTEKTFTYIIRELTPNESSIGYNVPGLTYSDERYQADVKVVLNKTESKLELEVESTTIYRMNYDEYSKKWVADKTTPLTAARFTNFYDPNTSVYRMAADKVFTTTDDTKELGDGDYTLVMKVIGENAAKAPMPKNTQGTGADRCLEVVNDLHMVRFLNHSDPDDGLRFDHDSLNEAGFDDDALREGVAFEYELYEKIPQGAANNNDGTWSLADSDGNVTVYDGIHHTRKLEVKLIENPEYDSGDPSSGPEEIISVIAHKDDNADDFYIDKNGEEKPVSELPGYDAAQHHTKGGAPIFHNYYFHQVMGELIIKKSWKDENDMDEIRPDSVRVKITSDEDDPLEKTETITRDAQGHMQIKVTGLPIYSDKFDRTTRSMKRIKYTVQEIEEGVIDGTAEGYVISYDTTMPVELEEPGSPSYKALEITVINTHTPVPGAVDGDETYGLVNQPQRGTPDYEVNPRNPMKAKHLVIPEGATQDDDGWVIIPGEGKYFLNHDDERTVTFIPEKDYWGDPTPIEVFCEDKLGNTSKATYTPHVKKPRVEEETITRTIHFTYDTKDGRKVVEDVVQKVTISRTETKIDPKTGKSLEWSDWTSATFPSIPNPDDAAEPGYTTSDSVPSLTVNKPGKVDDVYVVYTKQPEPTPPNKDDKHGKGSHGKSGNGKSSSVSGSTGDRAMPMIFAGLMTLAAIALVTLLLRRRREQPRE